MQSPALATVGQAPVVADHAARYLEVVGRGLPHCVVSLPDLAGPGDLDDASLSYARVALRGAGARRAASPGSRRHRPTAPTQP